MPHGSHDLPIFTRDSDGTVIEIAVATIEVANRRHGLCGLVDTKQWKHWHMYGKGERCEGLAPYEPTVIIMLVDALTEQVREKYPDAHAVPMDRGDGDGPVCSWAIFQWRTRELSFTKPTILQAWHSAYEEMQPAVEVKQ